MAVRLFRPLRGWREFSGEVGIIVLGVMIALSAGQFVDAWQWRQQVKNAHEVFSQEMGPAVQTAYLRLAVGKCNSNRLQEIAAKLNEPAGFWKGMPEQLNVPDAPFGTKLRTASSPYHSMPIGSMAITTEGWNNALANGTINHLPFVQSVSLAVAYSAARKLMANVQEEQKGEARISPLAMDRLLSSESRIAMLQTVKELDRLNEEIMGESTDVIFQLKQAKMVSDADVRKNPIMTELLTQERNIRGPCVDEPQLPPDVEE